MKKLITLLKLFPGLYSVPVAVLMFWLLPGILHNIDPTAATFDFGILHEFAWMVVGLVLINDLVFLGIYLNFPSVFSFYKKDFNQTLNNLNSWEKSKFLLVLFCLYFLAAVALLKVL